MAKNDTTTYDLMYQTAQCKIVVIQKQGYCIDPKCTPTKDLDGTWMHSKECHVPQARMWVRAHKRQENQHLRDDWDDD